MLSTKFSSFVLVMDVVTDVVTVVVTDVVEIAGISQVAGIGGVTMLATASSWLGVTDVVTAVVIDVAEIAGNSQVVGVGGVTMLATASSWLGVTLRIPIGDQGFCARSVSELYSLGCHHRKEQ